MSTTVTGSKRHLNINADEFAGDLNGTVNTATTATTQSTSDNSTKVATTAFVKAQGYITTQSDTQDLTQSGNTVSLVDGGSVDISTTTAVAANTTHAASAHAPSSAEQNVQSNWNATSGDAFILNKPSIPSISGLATTAYVDTAESDAISTAATAAESYSDGLASNYATAAQGTLATNALPKAGGIMSGAIAMGTSKITGMGNPTANQDAATKAYVDGAVIANTDTQDLTISARTISLTDGGSVTVPAPTYTSVTGKPTTFAPSSHTHTFASLTSKPTTIDGYGITDAFNGAYGSLSGTPTIPTDFVSKANGGTFSGALTIEQNGDALNLRSTTNGQPTNLTFSTNVPDSQIGHIKYSHSNSGSYGGGDSFTIGGTETTTVVLADGQLMYKDGIYSKPASGTGAGTRKDSNWDSAYTHSTSAHAPSTAEQNVQSDWDASSGDAFINNKPTIPSGNAIIDWTSDQGSTNIHAGNYTDTDTVYTHPTTAGNKHIPTGGASGQFLKYTSSGTAVWASDNNTVYTHPTTAGNKHVPTGGSSGQFLKYSSSGTAVWATPSYVANTDTNKFLSGISKSSNTLTFAVTNGTDQTYTFGANAFNSTTIPAAESYTQHENISAATSVNGTGRAYIQDITVDSNGHVTAIATASETVVNTNTQNSAATTRGFFSGTGINTSTGVITNTTYGTATTEARGLVQVGDGLDITEAGLLSATASQAATTSAAGDMSASDKTKLDGIGTAADRTGTTNVAAAGASMKTSTETISGTKTFSALTTISNATDSSSAAGTNGALRTAGGASIAKKLYVGSTITGSADVIAYSDKRLKKNVKTLDGKKVLEMRGVSFERTDSGKQSSGVIAQEMEKVAPELVIDDGNYKGVAYGNVVGYLIEAIKDQQKQIDELKELCNGCSK